METDLADSLATAQRDIAAGRCVLVHGANGTRRSAVMVAAGASADAACVNLIAKHARGLICLALTRADADRVGLRMQPRRSGLPATTGFTVSIEAAIGVTTGISAEDRARTIAAAIDPASGPEALHTPGHVFPFVVADAGVLERPMLAEAALDLARMAGCGPYAVFSEVLDDSGELADIDHVRRLAALIGAATLDIDEVIRDRRRTERIIARSHSTSVDTEEGGPFRLHIYRNLISGAEHIALVKGDPDGAEPIPVRIHGLNVTDDLLRWRNFGQPDHLGRYLAAADRAGRGIIILIREHYSTTLAERFIAREREEKSGYGRTELVDLGVPAQILGDLGVRDIVLLSGDETAQHNLRGFGINCVATRSVDDA